MTEDDRLNDPPKVEWAGEYIRVMTRGGWEYVERCKGMARSSSWPRWMAR